MAIRHYAYLLRDAAAVEADKKVGDDVLVEAVKNIHLDWSKDQDGADRSWKRHRKNQCKFIKGSRIPVVQNLES